MTCQVMARLTRPAGDPVPGVLKAATGLTGAARGAEHRRRCDHLDPPASAASRRALERATLFFWALVATLLGASAFYGSEVWRFQAANAQRDVVLASGDVVTLKTVIDGDTLVVSKDGAGLATVRLLGIKAFEAKQAKDDVAVHGRAAEEALRRLAADQPLRVLLNTPPKDKHGRTLASLYVGADDLGLALVARGHALAYSVYPFAQMQAYLQAQNAARAQRLGLWADPAVVERAEGLIREWARATP